GDRSRRGIIGKSAGAVSGQVTAALCGRDVSSHGLAKDRTPPLYRRSVLQLAQDLRELRISARALLDHYLERIETLNPKLNAFVFVDALAAHVAAESDSFLKAGRPRSPLEGIPIAVKDNLWVRRCPAVWGSPLFAGHI